MARIVKPEGEAVFQLNGDHPEDFRGELRLIGDGKRAYLWIETSDGKVATFSGPVALVALAQAILRELK